MASYHSALWHLCIGTNHIIASSSRWQRSSKEENGEQSVSWQHSTALSEILCCIYQCEYYIYMCYIYLYVFYLIYTSCYIYYLLSVTFVTVIDTYSTSVTTS